MKRTFSAFVLLSALFLWTTQSQATILIGSLSPITTASTNSPVFQTNTVSISVPQITISNNGLAITNAYTGTFQVSFDGTNFVNAGPVFTPTTTNAGSATVLAQGIPVKVYWRMAATTNVANTATIQIGVSSP